MKTRFTLSDDWPMVVAVALENSSVSHCDDKFLTCNYSGGTVIWKDQTDPDKFYVEIAGQVGTMLSFNDILFVFTGREN